MAFKKGTKYDGTITGTFPLFQITLLFQEPCSSLVHLHEVRGHAHHLIYQYLIVVVLERH